MADLVVLVEPGAGCTALVADSAVQQGLHIHLVLRHKGVGLEQPEKNIPTAIAEYTTSLASTLCFDTRAWDWSRLKEHSNSNSAVHNQLSIHLVL